MVLDTESKLCNNLRVPTLQVKELREFGMHPLEVELTSFLMDQVLQRPKEVTLSGFGPKKSSKHSLVQL